MSMEVPTKIERCVCVCARAHAHPSISSTGNHCWPEFLFFHRKQNGGVWEFWNNAVKVSTTQVRERGSCESGGSARREARPISASGTMCWFTFHPMAFV